MEKRILGTENKISLVEIKKKTYTEWAVVYGYDEKLDCWDFAIAYVTSLSIACVIFADKVKQNDPTYIPRCRLEEMATQFKDRIIEIEEDYFNEDVKMMREYFENEFDCDGFEMDWLGLTEEDDEVEF